MLIEKFKVFRVSLNTNSFGLREFYMMAKNGVAYKACANSLNVPKKGETVSIPLIEGKEGVGGFKKIEYNFAAQGFEIPERLKPDAPLEVVNSVWE